MKHLKVVFMGTPEFASTILEALIPHITLVLVVTQPDSFSKKGVMFSSVKTLALKHQFNIFQPTRITNDYQSIIDAKPDLIITAAYGQFIPKAVIALCPAINVHGSLLPLYRGGAPIQKAIIDGQLETGITIIHMTKKMDAGAMIARATLPILSMDTYQSLSKKLSILGAETLLNLIHTHGANMPLGLEQEEDKITFAYILKREDEHLRFNQSVDEFLNRMRALLDQPVGHILVDSVAVKIYDAKKSDIIYQGMPGEVLETHKKLVVMCKDAALEILSLQLPGKKKLDIAHFLNGQKVFIKGKVLL